MALIPTATPVPTPTSIPTAHAHPNQTTNVYPTPYRNPMANAETDRYAVYC